MVIPRFEQFVQGSFGLFIDVKPWLHRSIFVETTVSCKTRPVSADPTRSTWVLLSYRVPREPSTARIALWRRLRKLGVAQIGDGLVALPHDDRTKELLEWHAASVEEAGGDATVWLAEPVGRAMAERLVESMHEARDAEYQALIDEIAASRDGLTVDGRTLARFRRTLRDINRRDYFLAPLRDAARRAVRELDADDASQVRS